MAAGEEGARVHDDREDSDGGYEAIAGFGEKLRMLREAKSREIGRKVTRQEIADFVTERTGRPCGRAYISALEKGDKPAPMADKLAAIAQFFDVPAGYFFNDERSRAINAQLELVQAVVGEEKRLAALRLLKDLDNDDLNRVSSAIQQALDAETKRGGPRPGVYEP